MLTEKKTLARDMKTGIDINGNILANKLKIGIDINGKRLDNELKIGSPIKSLCEFIICAVLRQYRPISSVQFPANIVLLNPCNSPPISSYFTDRHDNALARANNHDTPHYVRLFACLLFPSA